MIEIIPIPALNDNYIFAIVHPRSSHVAIVDPGEAKPVMRFIKERELTLSAILITHHHWDHTNGIAKLVQHANVPVYAPARDGVAHANNLLQEGDMIHLPNLNVEFNILDIPGHTRGHIAYVGSGSVFCGDTLFLAGCGRLFEGSAEQMYQSLQKLASLPDDTQVYCAHEYTTNNLRFAKAVEPNNENIEKRITWAKELRSNNEPTIPAPLSDELSTNPFLRCQEKTVIDAVNQHYQTECHDPVTVFAKLREWKDQF
jgi:hydroxyacylglutathione hydrolase